mmetsp:Transcript_112758/g.318743  ORF Transcript_112758/g.318743 Transcript_112758/m.318743 type:complete len:319 (+) Transcript_112758:97-1053(+)
MHNRVAVRRRPLQCGSMGEAAQAMVPRLVVPSRKRPRRMATSEHPVDGVDHLEGFCAHRQKHLQVLPFGIVEVGMPGEQTHGSIHELLCDILEDRDILFYGAELLVEEIEALGKRTNSDLHVNDVAPPSAAHKLAQGCTETLQLDRATFLVVQEFVYFQRFRPFDAYCVEQLLHDTALDGSFELALGNFSAPLDVGLQQGVHQSFDGFLAVVGLELLHAGVGYLRCNQRVIDDDADDHVYDAEGGDHHEQDEKYGHYGLPVDDVPHDVVAPTVQGQDLKEREHRAEDRSEVLLVRPNLAIVRWSDAVSRVVLADLCRH